VKDYPLPLQRMEEIHWTDHVGRGGWARSDAYRADTVETSGSMKSLGYVLRETPSSVTLIQSQCLTQDIISDSVVIAKVQITKRRRVR
jgi:hypothetical protein